jgi:lysophospholipase L1-like esterase
MRLRTLLLLSFLPAVSSFAATAVFVPAANPAIVVEGRSQATPAGAVRLGFPGVTLHLHYHGSALAMRLNASSDEAFFDVIVDHGAATCLRMQSGEHDYPILHESAPADHVIDICRRTESWEGVCTVIGFDLGPDGSLLPPPPLPARKFLFIGDSITCGANADYSTNDPPATRTQHNTQWCNAQVSFGKVLARKLDAQCQLVSYGGRGVTRDWQGLTNLCNAPQFYKLALPDDPSATWDPQRYVPDVIGLCLGANDFNQGVPDEQAFVSTYVHFVTEVRRDAPQARIFLLECPLFGDDPRPHSSRTILRTYLEETIRRLGDPRVTLAPVSYVPGNPADHHPTRADHAVIAAQLEPLFRQALTDAHP